jgi:alpha-2-macroglobulin
MTTKAPLTGLAWVSVETDEILDTLLVPLSGNAGRIELPIKKEYAPNAFVSVYLTHPGGEGKLPRERFAFTELGVRRPDRELKIEPRLSRATARTGETIRGDVHVSCDGKPAPKADLAMFVVDDAVLQLGDWHLPDLVAGFYCRREFGVRSFESLASYQEEISSRNLTQKGFVIGDGGEGKIGNVANVRKEFRTLAFWQGNLKIDEEGNASFEFTAPDNLTSRFSAGKTTELFLKGTEPQQDRASWFSEKGQLLLMNMPCGAQAATTRFAPPLCPSRELLIRCRIQSMRLTRFFRGRSR